MVAAATITPATTPAATHRTRDGATSDRIDGDIQHGRARFFETCQTSGAGRLQTIQTIEERERLFGCGAAVHGRHQEAPRCHDVAAAEGFDTRVEQLLTLALALGDRAARPLHVGTRARVAVIEEQHTRPHADRELVLAGKIMVESGEEEVFDSGVAVSLLKIGRCRGPVGAKRVGHQSLGSVK